MGEDSQPEWAQFSIAAKSWAETVTDPDCEGRSH